MRTKKILIMLLFVAWYANTTYSQGVAINTSGDAPNASAMLDISSTTKGFLMPRMLESERTGISLPATGLLVYQTDGSSRFWFYQGFAWVSWSFGACEWTDAGDHIYPTEVTDNVGIGTSSPLALLSVGTGSRFRVNSSGNVLADGAMTAPSFSFTADNNTGMHLAGTDILRFIQNAIERMTIIADGNVGIGTAGPAALFSVGSTSLFQVNSTGNAMGITGTAGAPSFSFTADADNGMYLVGADNLGFSTAGNLRISIGTTGAVGIGSATPGYLLDVKGAIRTGGAGLDGQLRIYNELGGTDYEVIFNPAAAMTQTTTYTLPGATGTTGQVLTTDGSGTLTWTGGNTTYVELMQSLTYVSMWADIDLSSYGVSDGDIVEVVMCNIADAAQEQIGCRDGGTSGTCDAYVMANEAESGPGECLTFTAKATGAKIQIRKTPDPANITAYLIGYWH